MINNSNIIFDTPTYSQADLTRWIAPISRWSVWQEDDSSNNLPNVSFVESSLRRKLSSLAKMSLKVANDCTNDISRVHLVYASRHGDLNRTTEMLLDLAEGQALSPTAFSMSVLNAFTGVYSIAKQDKSPSTAISAAKSSFGFGLLEASLQLLSDPETPVLFVYADEPAPHIYGISSEETFVSHAIALLLTNDATTKITCEMMGSEGKPTLTSQSYTFLQCLYDAKSSNWHGEGRVWNWNQHEH